MLVGLAEVLGGCEATLSTWHVPAYDRRHTLIPDGGEDPDGFGLLGVWIDTTTRYRLAPEDGRARCLCGWRPDEAAVAALQAMRDLVLAEDRRLEDAVEGVRVGRRR